MCSKLTIKRPGRRQWCLFVNFIVNFMHYDVLIANFEHVSYLAQREKCRNTSFILKERKKSNKFKILQIEMFFHLKVSTPPRI